MLQIAIVLLCSLAVFLSVEAVDYTFVPSDEPTLPCPRKQNYFLDTYFDYSHLESHMIDEDTMILNGYVTFTYDLNSTEPISLKMIVRKSRAGRWMDTGVTMFRDDVCATVFSENEIWHDIVKGLPTDCPPKKGTIYEFRNKSLKIVSKDLPPGLEGLYRFENTLVNSHQTICFILEGEVIRV